MGLGKKIIIAHLIEPIRDLIDIMYAFDAKLLVLAGSQLPIILISIIGLHSANNLLT